MGQEYQFSCDGCGLEGNAMEGAGESGYVDSFFCKKCSSVTAKWSEHDFVPPLVEDESLKQLIKEVMEEYKRTKQGDIHANPNKEIDVADEILPEKKEHEFKCKKCGSTELSGLTFIKKMKCPRCNSRKFHFKTYADWD